MAWSRTSASRLCQQGEGRKRARQGGKAGRKEREVDGEKRGKWEDQDVHDTEYDFRITTVSAG